MARCRSQTRIHARRPTRATASAATPWSTAQTTQPGRASADSPNVPESPPMKNINNSVRVRTAIAAAVQGALLSLAPARPAPAAEPASGAEAVAQLTQPSGELEVGAGDVTKGSYKFGEYNGLEHE